jgi:hypothetical protein
MSFLDKENNSYAEVAKLWQYNKVFRGRAHTHNFHYSVFYNHAILLSVVNLLLYLIYKSNFIMANRHRKKYYIFAYIIYLSIWRNREFSSMQSQISTGVLEGIPSGWGG